MLSVVMLIVVMLSVVAPIVTLSKNPELSATNLTPCGSKLECFCVCGKIYSWL